MTISVIIATYNRAGFLEECLASLARQPFSDGDEVIVVDNGSTDRTAQVVTSARPAFPIPVRFIDEPVPGKSRALGRALAVATGDIMALTDDDVVVGAQWLTDIRTAMADPHVALVGGIVHPRWECRPPWWLRAVTTTYGPLAAPLAILDYGPDAIDLGPRTVLGANMAVRGQVLRRVGGFATFVGKRRGTLMSGEDRELCRRVQAAGQTARYVPAMRVQHWIPRHRMRVGYYIRWFFWSGITHARLDADGPSRRSLFGVPPYVLRRVIMSAWATMASAVTGNGTACVTRLLEVAFAVGYAAQCWGWPRDRFVTAHTGARR